MKHNYPIKYAVLPIKDKNSRDDPWYDICYVIVKCYVLEERKHHRIDGKNDTNYFVVCPYHYDQTYFHWVKSPPDDYYGEWVKAVYDTYEAALEEKERKNAEVYPLVLDDKKRKKYVQLYQDQIELFNQFEKDVEEGTKELQVNNKPDKQYVFSFSLNDNKLHKQKYTLYELIEWSYNELIRNPFIVYHVNPYVFRKLNEMAQNEESNVSNYTHIPLLMNSKDNEYMKLVSHEGNVRYLRRANNSDHFWNSEESKFQECETVDNYIFTLEDYNDIVNAYGLDSNKNRLNYGEQHQLILKRFYNS